MSLSQVLKQAKKYGFPVVITNDEGEDSYVLLPFDQFDALMDGTRASEPSLPRVIEDVIEDEFEAQRSSKIDAVAESLENTVSFADNSAELSTEEKFYLEPIDDEA